MKNLYNIMKQRREAKFNECTKMVAIDKKFWKNFMKLCQEGTKEEKDDMLKNIKDGSLKAEKVLLPLAIKERLLSKSEYKEWVEKYGLKEGELSTVLQGYYHYKKEGKGGRPIIITTKKSAIFKFRKRLREIFGVKVISENQFKNIIQKEDKKNERKNKRDTKQCSNKIK